MNNTIYDFNRYNEVCIKYNLPRIYCAINITDTLSSQGSVQNIGFGLTLQHFEEDKYSLLIGQNQDKHHLMLMLFFVELILGTRNFENLSRSSFYDVIHNGVNYDSTSDELIDGLLKEPVLKLKWAICDFPPNYIFEYVPITENEFFASWED